MDQVEFLQMVERAAVRQRGSLDFGSSLREIGWDSLAVILLISELDRLGGYSLDVDAVAKASTVGDLYLCVFR